MDRDLLPDELRRARLQLAVLIAIYALAMLCAFYPSRMATRLAPVEALRWE